MKNQISTYDQQKISDFQQELLQNKQLIKQVHNLTIRFSYLFLGYCALFAGFFLYFVNISELNASLGGGQIFWIFPTALFGLIKYHRSYNRKKKIFAQDYKTFLIPKILKTFHKEYIYAREAEYEDNNYKLLIEYQKEPATTPTSQNENIEKKPDPKLKTKNPKNEDNIEIISRNINPDIQKMIDVGLLERGNGGFQASWLMLLFPFLNVFFGRWLLIKFATKKKPSFEDFFGITKDKTSFKAIEIQGLLRSLTSNTPNSKFLTKFSYKDIKYTLAKKTKFFIRLTSLKTKRKNFQFSIKKILFYGGAFILLGLPLLDLLFSHKKLNTIQMHLMMMGLMFAFTGLGFVRLISLAYKKRFGNYTKKAKKLTNIQKGSVLFSEDFLDYYDIQTNDQLFANDFLNPSLKEKLMLLHQHYKGSYDFYFEGKDFYCIKHLPKGKHFLDSFSHRNRDNPKTLTKLYAEIKELDLLFSLLER